MCRTAVAITGPAPAIDPGLLTTLAAACRGHQRSVMIYRDRGSTESARTVEPYRLVTAGYRWYLMAFDRGRDDWRTFRVDRIGEPCLAGRFVPREVPEPASFVGSAITSAPYRYQARILLYTPVQAIADHIVPTTGVLTPAGGDKCELSIGSDSLDGITSYAVALGVNFTVLEPPELIEHLRDLAGRLLRATSA
jgi:predicted DNA-binding transcriptional regulator YafY